MKNVRVSYTIRCSCCTASHTTDAGEEGHREFALKVFKAHGWQIDNFGKHLCPRCVEFRKNKMESGTPKLR